MVVRLEAGQSKTRRARVFPFGEYPQLRTLLKAQRDRAATMGRIVRHVFHEPDGRRITTSSFYSSWRRARLELGVSWSPHDLRRTWARWALLQGIEPTTVMALGGWESMEMLRRYAIKDLIPLQAGVAKLGATAVPADTSQIALFKKA